LKGFPGIYIYDNVKLNNKICFHFVEQDQSKIPSKPVLFQTDGAVKPSEA